MPLSDGFTYCAECQHCGRDSNSAPPWKWYCHAHPRADGFGFVTRDKWDGSVPFLMCRDVNGGHCRLFERSAPGQMNLGVK